MADDVEQLRRDFELHRRETDVAITELRGEQSGHERVCAERYTGIIKANDEVKQGLLSLTNALAQRADKDGDRRWEGGWRIWGIVASVAGVLLVAMGWMAAQLFHVAATEPQAPPPAAYAPQDPAHGR